MFRKKFIDKLREKYQLGGKRRGLSNPYLTLQGKNINTSEGQRFGTGAKMSAPLLESRNYGKSTSGLRFETDFTGTNAGPISISDNEKAYNSSIGLRGFHNNYLNRDNSLSLSSNIGAGIGTGDATLDNTMNPFIDANLSLLKSGTTRKGTNISGGPTLSYGTEGSPNQGLNLGLKGNYGRLSGDLSYDFTNKTPRAGVSLNFQDGGMYDQMQQYKKGGTPKKGEFGSGKDAYTDEEWANMSSADRSRVLGIIGGGRPGNYTGIKIADPKKKETGGMALPGGEMQPIPGSDAVEFIGQSHDQGGIMVDSQTEVEGGETMDKVNMAKKGGKRDYFFSDHLKKGGKSYAEMHKEILANGGDQEEINMLAKMQEKAAGRNPKQVAKLGGVMNYQGGGYPPELLNDSTIAHRYNILDDISDGKPIYNEISNNEFINPNPEQYFNNFLRPTEEEIIDEENKLVEEVVEETTPPKKKKKKKVVVKETTPKKREEESLIKLPMRQVTPEQWEKTFPGLYDTPSWKTQQEEPMSGGVPDDEIEKIINQEGSEEDKTRLQKFKARFLQGDVPLAAYTAGLAQLFPAAYAIFRKQDDAEQSVYTPGFTSPIIAERGKASTLERVNYNAERSRNAADMRGINKFIETSGGGPANIINKMSAYARKQEGDMKITAAETRANADISNREAQMNQQMSINNMQRAQQASMTNAQLSRAETARMDQISQMNDQARQKLKDDQEAMKYQGIGLGVQGIAGLAGDVMQYRGQERLARSIGTDGVYQRDRLRNLFRKANPDATEEEINMLVANYTNNTSEAKMDEKNTEAEKYKNIING